MSPSSTSNSERPSAVDADGLVVVAEYAPLNRRQRAASLMVCLLFLGLLGGSGILDTVAPALSPTAVGDELDQVSEQRRQARIADGSLMAMWSQSALKRSNLHNSLGQAYSAVLLRGLRELRPNLVLGVDDWLFVRSRVEVPVHTPSMLARLACLWRALDLGLAAHGVELTLLPIPRKETVCREFLPAGLDANPELDGAIIDAILWHGVRAVDLREAWSHRSAAELYLRLDSHWSPRGQMLAAEAVAQTMGLGPSLASSGYSIEPESNMMVAHRPLLQFAGIDHKSRIADYLFPPDFTPRLQVLGPQGKRLRRSDIKWGKQPTLIGTSFSDNLIFEPYLHYFTGRSFTNAAAEATHSLRTLVDCIRAQGPRIRGPLLLEVPLHQMLETNQSLLQSHAQCMQSLAPKKHVRLAVAARQLDDSSRTAANSWRTTHHIAAGALATSGDGAVWLKVEARPGSALPQLSLDEDGYSPSIPQGDAVAYLPVLGAGVESAAIRLYADAAKPEGYEVQVITPFREDGEQPASSVVLEPAGDVWQIEYHFAAAVRSGIQQALRIDLASAWPNDADLFVQLAATGGDCAREYELKVLPGCIAVLSLPRALADGALHIRLGSSLPLTAAAVARIQLSALEPQSLLRKSE